ncbi:Diphthine synthase [Spraguea lophii 42_110]|uniref:diphthine methyl ester synthase n=1 Tax=Spraguea lophii (strain 42_110) TaxID=1358809 RepID=S7W9R6_SPRLO|nr:Diphthine synthase [Spraguea lophii 42_110]
MLNIIGLGLGNEKDITLNSLEIIKNSDVIYLEDYTCFININVTNYEKLFGKEIKLCSRDLLEIENEVINESKSKNVTLLVIGTPLFATTHTDIIIRAKENNIKVNLVHNVSILSSIGSCGLYSYNFGKTVSIPYFTETWKPISFYDRIKGNIENKSHTLCLLDIRKIENRYMTANEAIEQLLEIENITKYNLITENSKIIVICRFATEKQKIFYDEIKNLRNEDFGEKLHSLIIPAELERNEEEHINLLFENGELIF